MVMFLNNTIYKGKKLENELNGQKKGGSGGMSGDVNGIEEILHDILIVQIEALKIMMTSLSPSKIDLKELFQRKDIDEHFY